MMRQLVEHDAATNNTGGEGGGEGGDGSEGADKKDKSQIGMYLERSEVVFAKASKQLAEAQRDFADLCIYLGEEPPGDPEKIFGQIIQFVKGIQAASVVAESKMKKKARPQIKLPNMIN
jgi:hypothetical protein